MSVSRSCGECQLLEERVVQHRSDLQRATRRSRTAEGDDGQREAALAMQRLQRAQSYLIDHRRSSHRGLVA